MKHGFRLIKLVHSSIFCVEGRLFPGPTPRPLSPKAPRRRARVDRDVARTKGAEVPGAAVGAGHRGHAAEPLQARAGPGVPFELAGVGLRIDGFHWFRWGFIPEWPMGLVGV